jgi:hypothetical protein
MLGEFLREAAVLVGVFGLLDEAVREGPTRSTWIGSTLAINGTLLAAGLLVEVRRR